MKPRGVFGLLGLWCVAVLGPAVVIGVNEHDDTDAADPLGLVLGFGGYLVQLAIFIFIMIKAHLDGHSTWWFIVSLLPWVTDGAFASSAWLAILATVVVLAFAGWMGRVYARADALQRRGIRVVGTITKVFEPHFTMIMNGTDTKRKVRVTITGAGVEPYEGELKAYFRLWHTPDPGDRLPLRVDPGHPDHLAIDRSAEKPAAAAQPRSVSTPDVAARLGELDRLREGGMITAAEYNAKRQDIIAGI